MEDGRNVLARPYDAREPVVGIEELEGPETVHHNAAGHDE
jgi:hypothetical protein